MRPVKFYVVIIYKIVHILNDNLCDIPFFKFLLENCNQDLKNQLPAQSQMQRMMNDGTASLKYLKGYFDPCELVLFNIFFGVCGHCSVSRQPGRR